METIKVPAEHKVVLRGVSWETYERLMAGRGEGKVPRFFYDRGMMEIMSPSAEHESISYFIALVISTVSEEMGVNAYGVGSTTFTREDLDRGFEPDACFYVANEEQVRGKKRLDLAADPPPDLVIEIDITSPSLDKLPIYARLGIPEVWRNDGERTSVFVLGERGTYSQTTESSVLPPLTDESLSRFVEESTSLGSTEWLRMVRRWVREHPPTN